MSGTGVSLMERHLAETTRVANDAHGIAVAADHKAERAHDSILSHEKVCAERYANITNQLKAIPDIYKGINELSRKVYTGIGVCIGVTSLFAVVGSIVGILKLVGKL